MAKSTLEFVSYTGEYPNLCRGVLTVKIDGKMVTFGNDGWKQEKESYPTFWKSGGSWGFDDEWNEFVFQGEWELQDEDRLGDLKHLAKPLIDLFNANVPFGCCGGCI